MKIADKNRRKLQHQNNLRYSGGFIQLSRGYRDHYIELNRTSPLALSFWFWLVDVCNYRNEVHTEEESILAGACLSRRSLYYAYRLLEERRFIVRTAGTIHLNARLVWRGKVCAAKHTAELYCEPVFPVENPEKEALSA